MSRHALTVAVLLASVPGSLRAQQTMCFNGAPLPACSGFLIVEMQGAFPVVQSSRTALGWQGSPTKMWVFDDRPQWELGMMRNLNERWALGGAARLGQGSHGALTGLTARGRYWLTEDLGVDMSAGATFVADHWGGAGSRRLVGQLADARLNFRDDFYAGVRLESVRLPQVNEPPTWVDPGGRQQALSLLLGAGSEWGLGATALTGLALLLFFATADFS